MADLGWGAQPALVRLAAASSGGRRCYEHKGNRIGKKRKGKKRKEKEEDKERSSRGRRISLHSTWAQKGALRHHGWVSYEL